MITRSDYSDYLERVNAINTYKLTYHSGNSEIASGSPPVDSEIYIRDKEAVIKDQGSMQSEHYSFQGWSLTEEGSVDYFPGDIFTFSTSNIILWAVWQKNEYTLCYFAEGYEGELEADQVTTFDVPLSVAAYLDMQYWIGWCTSPDGKGPFYMFGDQIYLTEDTTLYGICGEQAVIRLQYDIGDAEGQTPSSQWGYPGDKVTLAGQGSLKKTGYQFLGWATSSGAQAIDFEAGDTVELGTDITYDITIHPVWEELVYSVTYYQNTSASDEVSFTQNSIPAGSLLEVLSEEYLGFVNLYYSISGWSDSNGNPVDTKNLIIYEDLELHAEWDTALDGEGSSDNPFQIDRLEAFSWIGVAGSPYPADAYYLQLQNLVALSDSHYSVLDDFTGVFDGDYLTISGLDFSLNTGFGSTEGGRIEGGLFSKVSGGTIKNIHLQDFYIRITATDLDTFGLVIGKASNDAVIKNVSASAGILVVKNANKGAVIGGLVGELSDSRISHSYSNMELNTGSDTNIGYAGGLVGSLTSSKVSESFTSGSAYFYGDIDSWGGLTGRSSSNVSSGSKIIDCYSTQTFFQNSGTGNMAGGLAGYSYNTDISHCYATGNITYDSGPVNYTGGIVGNLLTGGELTSLIAFNDYLYGLTTGRIYSFQVSSEITAENIYANSSMRNIQGTVINSDNSDDNNGRDLTSDQFMNQIFLDGIGWDFNTVWKMGTSRPVLQGVGDDKGE